MRVLVACEFSGVVREAFNAYHGVHAVSCDLLPAQDGRVDLHHQGDARDIIGDGWDLMVAHPPCTYLCSSGLHWNSRGRGWDKTEEALDFVRLLLSAPIPHIAVENPIGCISSRIRKPDQIIQPWQFGHPESKATCLWLKNCPPLTPTRVLPKPASGRWENQTASGQNRLAPSPTRWMERSVTYSGIAAAMAEQWVTHIVAEPATPITTSLEGES